MVGVENVIAYAGLMELATRKSVLESNYTLKQSYKYYKPPTGYLITDIYSVSCQDIF